jgi:hypothetical protein
MKIRNQLFGLCFVLAPLVFAMGCDTSDGVGVKVDQGINASQAKPVAFVGGNSTWQFCPYQGCSGLGLSPPADILQGCVDCLTFGGCYQVTYDGNSNIVDGSTKCVGFASAN